ncbi:MAG: hypothetical protein B6I20_01590 [Bacteroidetes bacterium 4572_117]|nr:MAG: hypothetical protein B6I20_01590 [Bacteroidetes bacterium 4572_117]
MKKTLFLLCLFFLACSDKSEPIVEEINKVPPELIGKWKIVEIYETDGGSLPSWRTYNSGNEYHVWFKFNNKYEKSGGALTCLTGNYTILDNNYLRYNSVCGGEQEVYIELLKKDSLIIDLKIFEAHKLRYIKISSEGE